MKKEAKKSRLANIPAWALALIFCVLSIISAFVFEYVTMPGYDTLAIIGTVFYIIVIPVACFIICRVHPKSKWYTPFICNPVSVLGTIFHPLAWTTLSEYLFFVGSLALSVIAAIVGAKIGQRTIYQAE